jgi:hypothetical protein
MNYETLINGAEGAQFFGLPGGEGGSRFPLF